ncbi:uncharacterized protein LOC143037410 [Oratosquilla oratoria]|uniref:uncharacterized protein LOC143037410 n=1 Tax=Oratosquilla oratoria TaxID=337810 RepID=UPI003F76A8FC
MSLLTQELLLPITPTGHHFFQDSIFDQSRRHFDMAIREIIERRGMSTTDHMNSYRSLRQKELREDNQAISITDEHQARKITLDVKDFKDGDLSVKAIGHSIVVEGRVERKEGSSVSSHSFLKRFSLPGVVDMSTVTSAISSDGILTITAPKTKMIDSSLKLQIPISNASSVQEATVQKSTTTQQGTSLADIESQVIGSEKTTATDKTEQTSTSSTKTETTKGSTGRIVAIQPETPLPLMVRGSFFDDIFFSNVHRDFEDGIDKILRRYNIGSSTKESKESLTNYRTLRGGNLTDETQAVTLSEDDTSHKIVLDVQDFKDGDVQLKAVENSLVVEGRVEKTVDGSKSVHTFRRRFALPTDTDLNDVTAAMSSDGILTIMAKKNVKALQSSGQFVPVQRQSDVQQSSSQITQKQTTTSQTSQTNQSGTVPIEVEGKSVTHLQEQQQQLQQQQQKIQDQLTKITQQQQYIKEQQQEIEKQRQACEKLQQEAQEKLRIAAQLESTVKSQTEHQVPIVTEPESVASTPGPDTAGQQKSLHQQTITQQTIQQQQTTPDVVGRVLPIRTESMDSSVSGVSDVSSVLQHSEGNTQNVQQSTRSVITQSDTSKSTDSSGTGDSKITRTVESSVKDLVLPIERRGDFFQDSFFGNDHKIFNSAVSNVLDRFGMKSTTNDALSTYRTLRQSVSMEESQAAQISEEEKSYKVVLDVRDFVGGDVKVKADGQMIVVEGRTERKEGNASSSQSFRRCFNFPTSVDMEAVTSALSSDGVLTITAPKSDHFSITEVDTSGQAKETTVSQMPQTKIGTTTSTSTSSRSKTATGWREESSSHESFVGDGVKRQVTSKTFQSSSTTGSSS